jgi:hypothetical protein
MKIKTSYACEFEARDLANLQHGHALSATLSDGTVAFTFRIDPTVVGDGTRRLTGTVREPGPSGPAPQLTEGVKKFPIQKYQTRANCPYCHTGPFWLQSHIRQRHPDKPLYPDGAHRCTQCYQRYATAMGLNRHTALTHKAKAKKG